MTKPVIDIDMLSIDEMLDLKDLLEDRLAGIAKVEAAPMEKRLERLQAYLETPAPAASKVTTKSEKTGKAAKAKSAPKRSKKSKATGKPAKGAKIAPKFRDPETGTTWTGRGRTPIWLRDYEAAGRKRDDFAL